MPRSLDRRALGKLGLLGVLVTSLGAMGCPGTLDPSLLGSGPGTGGSSGTGGTGGPDCTGAMDGATLVAGSCASLGCHDTADAPISAAGLDLTVNATIGARLVGVVSPGNTAAGSACGGSTYLQKGSNPAAGLFIDKIKGTQSCGLGMPFPGGSSFLLPPAQQACIEQWAEGLIMAAP